MDIVKHMIEKALADAGERLIDYDISADNRHVDFVTVVDDEIRFYVLLRSGDNHDLHTWFDHVAVKFANEMDDVNGPLGFYAIKVMNINQKNIVLKKIRYI